jgi:hypothetical protein
MRRILRAIEGEGDEQRSEDFEVNYSANKVDRHQIKAAYLDCSDVLAPMNGDDTYLKSDDDVVFPVPLEHL